jgi:hypothetical protein
MNQSTLCRRTKDERVPRFEIAEAGKVAICRPKLFHAMVPANSGNPGVVYGAANRLGAEREFFQLVKISPSHS